MKHIKLFEATEVKWTSIPKDMIEHVQNLIELHLQAAGVDSKDIKFKLGMEGLCRDIIKTTIDDYELKNRKFKK